MFFPNKIVEFQSSRQKNTSLLTTKTWGFLKIDVPTLISFTEDEVPPTSRKCPEFCNNWIKHGKFSHISGRGQ